MTTLVFEKDKRLRDAYKWMRNKDKLTFPEFARIVREFYELDNWERRGFWLGASECGEELDEALEHAEDNASRIIWTGGKYDGEEEFGEYMVEELDCWEMEREKCEKFGWFNPFNYLDYEKIGRDLCLCGDYTITEDPETGENFAYSNC